MDDSMTIGTKNEIGALNAKLSKDFRDRNTILSFFEYLKLVEENPVRTLRNSAEYLVDCFDFFGTTEDKQNQESIKKFKLFEHPTLRCPVVGNETSKSEIYRNIQAFKRQGYTNKIIFLKGPNGSSKTSTIESISNAMQMYSESNEGAVYRFNWIFPVDKGLVPRSISGDPTPIGFTSSSKIDQKEATTYAKLDESQISAKLSSEFKENPIFLIPMPYRQTLIESFLQKFKLKPDCVSPQIFQSGLSKRNQLIFETLLNAYEGNIEKVLRHVQVERFFYSRQYRVGISVVEPQMSMDAHEKLLTMDRNIANLPPVLHNIRFTETSGELVEANRGILEFSDILKRPLEAFKYLLTTVEKGTLGLPSGVQNLDVVFFATANEKHVDAFKQSPDFSSFRGRIEFITVPYQLKLADECKIYAKDIELIKKTKPICPHTLDVMSLWSVMTRLKQPDLDSYQGELKSLMSRLEPLAKTFLYNGDRMDAWYSASDQIVLNEHVGRIKAESIGTQVYEGRFGASPRELKSILYRLAESDDVVTITPVGVFDEIMRILRDSSNYDYLQIEPRNKYHDAGYFLELVASHFCELFKRDLVASMKLVEDNQFEHLLSRYIEHAVAFVKKDKILNPKTEARETPSEALMSEIETILGISGDASRFRESLLTRIASFRIEHKDKKYSVEHVFNDHLTRIKDHYFELHAKEIEETLKGIVANHSKSQDQLKDSTKAIVDSTTKTLIEKYSYDLYSIGECAKFVLKRGTQSSQ